MSAAQKAAQANFKKAIAYRKKNGCTLKQAFAKFKKPATKKAAPVKKAKKRVVKKAAPVKSAKKRVVKKAIGKIQTKSKKHTDYNKPTVNIQIGALKNGSTFISHKGYLIERKPEKIGNKKTYVYICRELSIADKTLSAVKARINFIIK